jgi:hypothetical protein
LIEKSEENLWIALAAVDSETDGEDGAFRDHGELDGKRKTGSKDELMDYVELFLLFMSAVAEGSKSFPMPLHGNGNKIMMSVGFA